jgi:hypothetical protein
MPFITDEAALGVVSDALKLDSPASLAPYWPGIVARANAWAYNEVVDRLLRRGLLIAQVTQWDRGAEVQSDLMLWKALTVGAGLEGFDDKFLKTLDRREELDKAGFFVAGVWLAPDGTAGQARSGASSDTGTFGWPGSTNEPRW